MLYHHTWGTGDRRILLVHGLTSDSTIWNQLGPDLAERGYRVDAVDLPGHGQSPRAERYTIDLLATTLAEWADSRRYEAAVGHSLGGLAIAAAAARLTLGSAVYLDPAWRAQQPGWTEMFRSRKNWTLADVAAQSPRWNAHQIADKHAMLERWDPDTVDITHEFAGWPVSPPTRPSLVLRADPSMTITDDHAERLHTAGFTVATIPDAGHVIHYDRYAETLQALDAWLAHAGKANIGRIPVS